MSEILFELNGELEDIKFLGSFLISGNWTIIEKDGMSYLKTEISDEIEEESDIRDIGLSFLESLNGAAKVIYYDFEKVGINSFYVHRYDSVNSVILLNVKVKCRSRVIPEPTILKFEGNDSSLPSQTVIEYYTRKASNHRPVREALHFFSEITWINLYKVFEIIRDDVGQKNIEKLYEKRWVKLFTQAAQSRDLLGDDARHASRKYKKPEIELSLFDAHKILKEIFHKWIIEK